MSESADRLFVAWRSAGDAHALAAVYDRTAAPLLRIAMHHVHQPAAAEDLVQATYLTAIEQAADYDPARPLLGWLVGILHNKARHLMRREGRAIDGDRIRPRPMPDPLSRAQATELTEQVDAAIATLPIVYQPVLRLSLKHHLGAAEIAHALGRPAGTVRSQFARGLELLRAALPTGVGGALVCSTLSSARGLDAVREVVLAHGAASLTGGSVSLPLVLSMKKALLVITAAALAVAALLPLLRERNVALSPDADGAPAGRADSAAFEDATTSGDDAALAARRPVAAAAAGWRLEGEVIGPDGAAADARVAVVLRCGDGDEPFAEVRTSVAGRYSVDLGRLRDLAPIDLDRLSLHVSAWAPGARAGRAVVEMSHRDPDRPLDLRQDFALERGVVVRGVVVDSLARPVDGAAVELRDAGGEVLAVETDADGSYRIDVAAPGAVVVTARHVRWGEGTAQGVARVGCDCALAELQLRSSAVLRGRLVFPDGEPVANVKVRVGGEVVRADGDGRFVVATLEPGTHDVELEAMRFGAYELGSLETGQPEESLILRGFCLVRIRFVDEQGRSLRRFSVGYDVYGPEHDEALRTLLAGGELTEELATSGSGIGGVEDLFMRTGRWVWVRASHGSAHGELLLSTAGQEGCVDAPVRLVERHAAARLRLHVVSGDGEQVGAYDVCLRQMQLGHPGSFRLEADPADLGDGALFRWQPGRYRMQVRPSFLSDGVAHGYYRECEQVVDLRDGAEREVTIHVQPGGRVQLLVHAPGLAAGADLRGFSITTAAAEGQQAGRQHDLIRTMPDGWLSGRAAADTPMLWGPVLPPGRHVLTVRAAGFVDQDVGVDVRVRTVSDVHVWLQRKP